MPLEESQTEAETSTGEALIESNGLYKASRILGWILGVGLLLGMVAKYHKPHVPDFFVQIPPLLIWGYLALGFIGERVITGKWSWHLSPLIVYAALVFPIMNWTHVVVDDPQASALGQTSGLIFGIIAGLSLFGLGGWVVYGFIFVRLMPSIGLFLYWLAIRPYKLTNPVRMAAYMRKEAALDQRVIEEAERMFPVSRWWHMAVYNLKARKMRNVRRLLEEQKAATEERTKLGVASHTNSTRRSR